MHALVRLSACLTPRVLQYSQKVSQQRGEWRVLRSNFCLDFYSLDRIGDLRLEVLSFKQKDNETLGKS